MKQTKQGLGVIAILVVLAVLVFGGIYAGITLTQNVGKSKAVVSTEKALDKLDKLYKDIYVSQVEARKEPVELTNTDLKDVLPEISKYPMQVEPITSQYVEIFASLEKTGKAKDGWLIDVAQAFNKKGFEINGQKVSVGIRGMSSGMGMDYIVSEKYTPDAYSPSNELFGDIMKAKGIDVTLYEPRLIGNVAGMLLSRKTHDALTQKYGTINLKSVTEAVGNNELAMGYTNPFASATGLNFLVSTLNTFDAKDPLSDKAIAGFEAFQKNVPVVAYTTIQMRESAESGVLDGFIMEYQTYVNAPDLKSDYIFTPFGVRHDSPLYTVGNLSSEKEEIMKCFIDFCKEASNQKIATEYGFNQLEDYVPELSKVASEVVPQAQKLWKEKKDSNRPIAAVFVADVSGSMYGEPMHNLQKSLISGAEYIGKENSIGLVTYSDDVAINLPIGQFDLNQRSLFTGAVMDMEAAGGTATFDGMIVGIKMLMEEKAKNPDTKLLLFVLSDGETNKGHSLNDIEEVLSSLKIPVYTVGYNANIKALEKISSINEAASINADSEDVVYKLGSLFNAQM